MAKKHRKEYKNQKSLVQNRDTVRIARRERYSGKRRDFVPQDDFRTKLPSEDFFGPLPQRTVHDEKGKPVNIVSRPIIQDREVTRQNDFRVSQTRNIFEDIRSTVCQRRKERREVLFAKRKVGKGAAKRTHMWNALSNILCIHS